MGYVCMPTDSASAADLVYTCNRLMGDVHNFLMLIIQKCEIIPLEAFLGELSKKSLNWPMHFSNTSAILALEMEAMRSRLVSRKLYTLKRLLEDSATGVGVVAMRSFVDDVESLCLVKECCGLKSYYKKNLTDTVLTDANAISKQTIRKTIRRMDK